ncbi:hypothetical protein NW845_00680 [Synechococcus sp. H60.2]
MKTGKLAGVLACLCVGLLTACQQAKDKNATSFIPGPIFPVQNPSVEPGGTGVGVPATPPVGVAPPTQPSPLASPPVSAPTIPPLPSPNPSPSIVGLPPAPLAAPTFTKSFSPSTTSVGVPVTLSFSITNNSGIQLTGLSFAEILPAGLSVAAAPGLNNTCGGTASAPANGSFISLTGGQLSPNSSCLIGVQVVATNVGTYTNPATTLTSDQAPAAQSAPVSLTVDPVDPPTFKKEFSPSTATPGSTVVVIFTITNDAPVPLSGLSFIDALPGGLRITETNVVTLNTCGGTLTANPSIPASSTQLAIPSTTIALQGGTLAPNSSCVVSVSVQQINPVSATYTNPPVTLFSSGAQSVTSNPATVTFNP